MYCSRVAHSWLNHAIGSTTCSARTAVPADRSEQCEHLPLPQVLPGDQRAWRGAGNRSPLLPFLVAPRFMPRELHKVHPHCPGRTAVASRRRQRPQPCHHCCLAACVPRSMAQKECFELLAAGSDLGVQALAGEWNHLSRAAYARIHHKPIPSACAPDQAAASSLWSAQQLAPPCEVSSNAAAASEVANNDVKPSPDFTTDLIMTSNGTPRPTRTAEQRDGRSPGLRAWRRWSSRCPGTRGASVTRVSALHRSQLRGQLRYSSHA